MLDTSKILKTGRVFFILSYQLPDPNFTPALRFGYANIVLNHEETSESPE